MTRPPDQAFLEFVKSRAAPLHRMAYLLCGDWHLADDLVQETLAKSFRHWHRVQRAENPDAYVRRMLINEARRHWRRNRNAVPADLSAWEPGVPDDAAAVTNRVALFQALLSLPARHRPALPGGDERAGDRRHPRLWRGHRQKPDIPGARLAPDLSPTRGDTTMNSQPRPGGGWRKPRTRGTPRPRPGR